MTTRAPLGGVPPALLRAAASTCEPRTMTAPSCSGERVMKIEASSSAVSFPFTETPVSE